MRHSLNSSPETRPSSFESHSENSHFLRFFWTKNTRLSGRLGSEKNIYCKKHLGIAVGYCLGCSTSPSNRIRPFFSKGMTFLPSLATVGLVGSSLFTWVPSKQLELQQVGKCHSDWDGVSIPSPDFHLIWHERLASISNACCMVLSAYVWASLQQQTHRLKIRREYKVPTAYRTVLVKHMHMQAANMITHTHIHLKTHYSTTRHQSETNPFQMHHHVTKPIRWRNYINKTHRFPSAFARSLEGKSWYKISIFQKRVLHETSSGILRV